MYKIEKLFEPGRIGKLLIKNRIAMAPMGIIGLIEPDGRISQRVIDYYVARAKGGVGLIITGLCLPILDIEFGPINFPRPYGRGFNLSQTSFALHLFYLVPLCTVG